VITTDAFIDLLEQQKLIKEGVARQLRAKSSQGDSRITPQSILKYLVKKELVSRAQARVLLETTLVVSDKAESSILGLAPLASPPVPKSPPEPLHIVEDEELEVVEFEDEASVGNSAPPADPFDAAAAKVDLASTWDAGEELTAAEPATMPNRPAAGSKLRPTSLRKPKGKSASPKKKKKAEGEEPKSQWDSPLLLMGGGALAVLAVGSVILWWLLFRETADKAFKEAQAAFDGGNYHAATDLYKEFTNKYSHHKDYSEAKVRIGLSQLWELSEGSNFAGAADLAPTILTQIENEPAFISNAEQNSSITMAKQDLSQLLPRIARGLADQAEQGQDEETIAKRLEQTANVLALASNTKYIPEELRQPAQIGEIQQTLDLVKTRLQKKVDLAEALKKMEEVTAAGTPAEALKIRTTLLLTHPSLAGEASLAEAVSKVEAAEMAATKFVEAGTAAITTPAESPIVAELALADRRGGAAAGAAAPMVVRIDGGLYGMNAGDGSLLWRRFVGADASSLPLLLPSGLVVAADAQRHELTALDAKTGKLAWRLPLEGRLATPVALGKRLLVASDAGRLNVIEQVSGQLIGYVQFSQPLRQAPAVNERGDRIYVLGEHSNLYTLSADNLGCIGVYYLGHAAGGAATSPVIVLNKLIVADNSGAETCQLRAIALNDQGVPTAEAASQRLSGLVTTPLQAAGRRFASVTSQGQAIVFEVAAANDKTALTPLASRDAKDGEQMARFGLLHDGHLWVAARDLTKLAILPTGNQLTVRSIERDYRGDAFDYPLQAIGNLVIQVRRPAGQGGAIVAAMDAATDKALWETAIAVPPAGAPAVDASSQQMVAGSSSGSIYVLNREALARRVQDQALHVNSSTLKPPVFNQALDLGGGRLALAGNGSSKIIHFRPNDPRQQLREVDLPGPLSGELTDWAPGFAAPSEVGQVFLYSAEDASPLATPFQPELTPGKKYGWLPSATVGGGTATQLVTSDGVSRVYALRLVDQPEPHLEAAANVDAGPSPLVTRIASVGSTCFVGSEAGKLARFTAPELTSAEPIDLGGRIVWGPFAAGDGVLLATDANELLFVGVDGAVIWRQPLAHGNVGGRPLLIDGHVGLLHPHGVAKISLSDGTEAGYVEIGQSLSAGPVAFAGRLVVAAADGTLLVVNSP
jgi:outer membrane protein assembly factor BamB